MNDERPGGSIRIGDSEREDAVRRLGEHYEAGRLSADEHSERVEQALQARTGADLDGLFADLPGAHQTTEGAAAAGAGDGGQGGEGWAGPWGWRRPPWTAPEGAAGANGPGRPAWAARGFLGRVPFPLLILLGVVGVLASIGCVVGGGHPPVLPLLLIVAGVLIVRKRRMERRA
ncbi:DUF1707 SHOCT-like domain-containing protein [Kribbella speibonae]|uniref:DUF1707 domain-containing protein n=1 Tax=Kribbella speibonae TaxID=1572660 RepID=A0ABY2AC21_9ACTN|nr:DUF1707 domain-containing protein [Kribbella speibonae]TCC27243.1 DUF1707 domain-containing protein [Kribbella speibonae]